MQNAIPVGNKKDLFFRRSKDLADYVDFCPLHIADGLYQTLFGRYGMLTTTLAPGTSVMKDKFYRFFWVEHPVMMILAIVLITLGYGMSKKAVPDAIKYKKAFWYFTIALVLILVAVPWPFRGIIGRPLLPGI